jgi:hypothetical protein
MRRARRIVPALIVGLWALAGCSRGGRPVARVSGVITYAGKPVPNGTVVFMPVESGPPAYGNIGPDGRYTLSTYSPGDGAAVGRHAVMITALEQLTPAEANNPNRMPKPLIPRKFTDIKTSGLTADVADCDNLIDFQLK